MYGIKILCKIFILYGFVDRKLNDVIKIIFRNIVLVEWAIKKNKKKQRGHQWLKKEEEKLADIASVGEEWRTE